VENTYFQNPLAKNNRRCYFYLLIIQLDIANKFEVLLFKNCHKAQKTGFHENIQL